MNKLFSSEPLWQNNGLAFLRIITGLLMAYHGLEVFHPEVIKGYTEWDSIKGLPSPLYAVYVGKGLELVSGIFLALGLFTRVAALLMFADMIFICFIVGNGKFYYEDQHPFIFALLALVFFFTGPVKFAIDHIIFKKRKKYF